MQLSLLFKQHVRASWQPWAVVRLYLCESMESMISRGSLLRALFGRQHRAAGLCLSGSCACLRTFGHGFVAARALREGRQPRVGLALASWQVALHV